MKEFFPFLLFVICMGMFITLMIKSEQKENITNNKKNKIKKNSKVAIISGFHVGFEGTVISHQPRTCLQAGGFFNDALYRKETWTVLLTDGTKEDFLIEEFELKE